MWGTLIDNFFCRFNYWCETTSWIFSPSAKCSWRVCLFFFPQILASVCVAVVTLADPTLSFLGLPEPTIFYPSRPLPTRPYPVIVRQRWPYRPAATLRPPPRYTPPTSTSPPVYPTPKPYSRPVYHPIPSTSASNPSNNTPPPSTNAPLPSYHDPSTYVSPHASDDGSKNPKVSTGFSLSV